MDEAPAPSAAPMALHAPSAVASSVLFAWLFDHTEGSVRLARVLHTAFNGWSSVIP